MNPRKGITDPDLIALWKRNWKPMEAAGLVDEIRVDAFEMLCSTIVKWRRADKAALALGDAQCYILPNDIEAVRPQMKLERETFKTLKEILKEFGLTVKSAKDLNISVDIKDEDKDAFDEL